jgi:hypothetical protein
MTKRLAVYVLLAALTGTLLASGVALASSGKAAPKVVPIVMADPGCHWFSVNGKKSLKLVVTGARTFRNLDEAALVFVGKKFHKQVAVGKSLTIAKRGVYHITMVGQAPDDNHLVLVVK